MGTMPFAFYLCKNRSNAVIATMLTQALTPLQTCVLLNSQWNLEIPEHKWVPGRIAQSYCFIFDSSANYIGEFTVECICNNSFKDVTSAFWSSWFISYYSLRSVYRHLVCHKMRDNGDKEACYYQHDVTNRWNWMILTCKHYTISDIEYV